MSTRQEQLRQLLAEPFQDVDLQREPLQTILHNVQGNILHGHGRNFATHIFLQFQNGKETEVKQWLRDHIVYQLTSAHDQLVEKGFFDRQTKNRNDLFVSCLLSASGYHYLRGSDAANNFSAEFQEGMKEAISRLQDPPCTSWEKAYQDKEKIHAMILLAHQDREALQTAKEKLVDDYGSLFTRSWSEYGNVLPIDRRPGEPSKEHFGYVESGASQPVFFQQDLDEENRKRAINRWDPSAGPHLVLTPDPLGGETDYGSYLVFRKLEQNVDDFEQEIKRLADALGVDQNRAKALVIGRFPNGEPLVPHNTPIASQDPETIIPNNFRYNDDAYGQLCPYHAHIRRMNPRWEAGGLRYDRRIARRSIPYGQQRITESVGLLFMCYQRSLKRQFEALQGLWAHKPDESAFSRTGNDPLIGTLKKGEMSLHQWPSPKGTIDHTISNFVTLQGGEYFFAPSINVLKTVLVAL